MKKNVTIIKSNLLEYDPRLSKVIDSLKRGGYNVTFLCWDRDYKTKSHFTDGTDYREVRLRLKAPYGVKVLLFIPFWWIFEFYWLLKLDSDFLHPVNFDSIGPAIIISKLKGTPSVYEISDVYADEIVLPRILRQSGVFIEKTLIKFVNAVIIANEGHIKEFGGIPNQKVVGVYNSPPDVFDKMSFHHNEIFELFFSGTLYKSRQMNLNTIFQAVKEIKNVKVVIAGYGNCVEEIKKWIKESDGKIEFIGKITYQEVLRRSVETDLLFALYNPVVPVIKYASANKLFEAMMCGKPILVSKGTGTAEIVEREKCGIIVDGNNVNELKEAISRLKNNPELCKKLGANGRRAYEEKYSWKIMEGRLLTLYSDLLKQKTVLENGS